MPTTRIKEKLSTLISSQLPEFIQSDYTGFKAFIEAYYEFLEQDQNAQELLQNARSYNDIDRTVDSFIDYFLKQYCDDIPKDVLYNKKALVKNIHDLYNSKGSEKSYKLLFKILYNKDVEFSYPSTQILKASDGKWVQKTSFFMKTITGDGDSILNKNLIALSSSTKYPLLVTAKKDTSTSDGVSADIFEYFFDNSKNVPINPGDIIEYGTFKGQVVSTPVSVTIASKGSGFKVGDILLLISGKGNSAKLKVTKVNSTGGILNAQLINFGGGYTGDFYAFFNASLGVVPSSTFDFTGGAVSVTERLGGFVERGTITFPSYAESYFAEDYQGEVLRDFYNSTSSPLTSTNPSGFNSILSSSTGDVSDAAIYVRLGAKAFYPGYYESVDGFLSDNIYLEDGNFYQPFSYVLKIDERLSLYKKAVLDILHPAGLKLFGELTLLNDIDISSEIQALIRYLTVNFQEVFDAEETYIAKDILKPASDSTGTDEFIAKDIIKPRSNSIDLILDSEFYDLTKVLEDSNISTGDENSKNVEKVIGLGEIYPYTESDYFAEDYTLISAFNKVELLDNDFLAVLTREIFTSQEINDFGSIFTYSGYTVLNDYFADDYVGEWLPGLLKDITKSLQDNLPELDDYTISITGSLFFTSEHFVEAGTPANETYSTAVTKSLAESTTLQESMSFAGINNTSDSVQTADSGFIVGSDYTSEIYFASDYVGTVQLTF